MLQKNSISKVFEVFLINPSKKFYLLEISRKIKLAHTSVKIALTQLEKKGLIIRIVEKKGSRKFPVYKASNSKEFREQKKLYNYKAIVESGLSEFLEEKLMPKAIVLFGSYAKGEDDESSDIDLFIECNEERIALDKYTQKLNRSIQLHFNKDFKNYPVELKNNIVNGITLKGYLEAFSDDHKYNSGSPKSKGFKENG